MSMLRASEAVQVFKGQLGAIGTAVENYIVQLEGVIRGLQKENYELRQENERLKKMEAALLGAYASAANSTISSHVPTATTHVTMGAKFEDGDADLANQHARK